MHSFKRWRLTLLVLLSLSGYGVFENELADDGPKTHRRVNLSDQAEPITVGPGEIEFVREAICYSVSAHSRMVTLEIQDLETEVQNRGDKIRRLDRELDQAQWELKVAGREKRLVDLDLQELQVKRGGFWRRHIGRAIGPTFLCDRDGCRGGLGGTWGFTW